MRMEIEFSLIATGITCILMVGIGFVCAALDTNVERGFLTIIMYYVIYNNIRLGKLDGK